MTEATFINEPFGPVYNVTGAAIDKHRRAARKGGLAAMSKADRHAYGDAVEKAVLASQRSSLRREKPMHSADCASGTFHNNGADIERAVRAQQRASLLACKSRIAKMEPDKVQELYDLAMQEKRARQLETMKPCKKAPAKSPMKPTSKTNRTTATARRASGGISSTSMSAGRGKETRRRATA